MSISEEKQLQLCLVAQTLREMIQKRPEETELLVSLIGPPAILELARIYDDLTQDPKKALNMADQALKLIDKEILKKQIELEDNIDDRMEIFEPFKTLITNQLKTCD
ncbi:hypothetical protein CMI41_01965 [Candidatus Pacearchaeota archaeon]|nr:hypothetical protein [Candidatus Pacearchaeota archaeon]|tara:strand:- start:740 stop:1060 length:321 start_codon:yes stop_codon:yes gene_type:complete